MSAPHARSQPTVLVIDDAVAVSTTLVWVLRQNGYDSAAAHSKAEALQLGAQLLPDLALIEMSLPDGTGIETARELPRFVPGCKTLFMSSDPEAGSYLQQARAAGLQCELLPKPIPVPELLQKLHDALPRRRAAAAVHA